MRHELEARLGLRLFPYPVFKAALTRLVPKRRHPLTGDKLLVAHFPLIPRLVELPRAVFMLMLHGVLMSSPLLQ